ncbi:MAG: sodium:proton antiporter [Haloferacaceae archaeon]
MTQVLLAAVLGLLFGLGTFLVLRRDVVRVVWGVSIISQATNVYLITMGGVNGIAPISGHGGFAGHPTDPIVQALILTAIVIGFGTSALALVLTYRVYQEHGTIDMYELGTGTGGDGTGDGTGPAGGEAE